MIKEASKIKKGIIKCFVFFCGLPALLAICILYIVYTAFISNG